MQEIISKSDTPVGNMRDTILRVAGELFAERGYNATSVREVVEAAGCKKPTLYYYFDNKESLFLEVLRNRVEVLDVVIYAALAGAGTVRDRLRRALDAYLRFVKDDPTTLKLMMTAERHPERGQPDFDFDAVRQRHIDDTRSMLEEGVASGELRGGFDFDEAVLALFGMIDHRLVLFLHGRPVPEDYPEQVLDLFFRGVGTP